MEFTANNLVEAVILNRHSVRAYTDQAVDPEIIQDLLRKASYAPSGTNTQPWKVYVVQGNSKLRISQQVIAAADSIYSGQSSRSEFTAPYLYYPEQWFEPYMSRRRENGWGMYAVLGISKQQRQEMHQQQLRNFKFFDAPVGLFFTTHRQLEAGAKMAIAMLMQNIMLLAKAQGLDTCPQASWNDYHKIIMPILGATDDEQLVCGMSLGYADVNEKINSFHPSRLSLEEFAVFLQ